MKKALGLIETIGLVTAIEAADAAVKAACVTLLGYENTRGGGKITVKVVGDVGAVQAAVSAGVAAAERIGKVYSKLVIPRPSEEIDELIATVARGQKPAPPPAVPAPKAEPVAPVAVEPVVEPEPCPDPEPAPMASEPVAEVVDGPEAMTDGPAEAAQAEAADDAPSAESPASAPVNATRGKSRPRGGKRR